MSKKLSDWAREFLQEVRVAAVSTLNKDGSPHVVSVWYLLADDGTLFMITDESSQKCKNLRRDPRIALCVGDGGCSISLYGRVSLSEDQTLIGQTMERLAERYVKEASIRPQVIANVTRRTPVALRFRPEKITEFSTVHTGSILSR